MLKRGGRGLTVVLFSLLVVVRVIAQGIPQGAASTDTGLGGVNTISGMIVSSSGQRIQRRVSVRLRTMTRGDQISTSDENGNFVFRNVPSGDFVVVIEKEKDFEPFSQSLSVIQPRGMPPQTYYLSIRLTSKPGTAGMPGVINADLAKVPKSAMAKYNKAIELAKNGDRSGAILQLQDAIAEYPQFMIAYNEIGVQYMKLNDLQKSDAALQAALKIDAKAYMPLMNRGIVLVMLKRYKDAEPLLREAVKMKSDQAVGHYFLGQSVAYLGNFDEAEKELSTAIKLGGEEMKEAHRLLAIIYSSRGEKKRAIGELETYLRLVPTTPDAEQLRGVILKLKGSELPPPTSKAKPSPAGP
jgi:Flp pilus assembly protein TadD